MCPTRAVHQAAAGVGFFFSLGHSSIVLALCLGLAVAAQAVESHIPDFQRVGGTIGASVSGLFLWLISILNLIVLLEIITTTSLSMRSRC